jgi:protein-S-isoprenylcysteine O-methyltransferase Ste14/tRNA A-37 threonylcarbamoyl transferase component Bud32
MAMIARSARATNPPPVLLSAGRNFTKARVVAADWQGRPAVLKSIRHQPAWLRIALGRRLLDREERTYRRLVGVPGVPPLLARPDPDTLVCARVRGRLLAEHGRNSLPASLFAALGRILEQAHATGVAHGDLHRRDVIVDESGSPWVIDWATSLSRQGGGALRLALFRRWMQADWRALEKLRRRYSMEGGQGASALEPEWAPHRWLWRLRQTGPRLQRWLRIGRGAGPGAPGQGDPAAEGRSVLWGRVRLAAIYGAALAVVAVARPTRSWIAVGLILLVPGEAVRMWAAGHLLKSKELVTSGPYAYTQNPLYLGRLLILSGLAMMCPAPWHLNWIFLGVGLAGFFAYYMPRKLRVEGSRLEERHGERWRLYRRSVPVLFPALNRYSAAEVRPWSWSRMSRNREYMMVLGLAAVVGYLWSRLPG